MTFACCEKSLKAESTALEKRILHQQGAAKELGMLRQAQHARISLSCCKFFPFVLSLSKDSE